MTQIPQAALDLLKQQGVTARPGTPEYTRQISTAAANRPPPRSYSEFYNVGPKSESGRWSGWAMPEQTSEEAAWTNPAYNPTQNDNGYTRFDHTIYGSGLERSKNFEAGARTFAAYQKLKPGQPGYDHARGALKKLSHNFGIDNWRAASPRQLFESFDLEMRGLQEDNQKENFKFGVGDLAKLVAAAAATVATAGAAAPYFGATLGGTVATGALAGAVGATTSGVLNNNLSLKGVVTGAGIGGLLAGGQYYFNPPVANPSLIGGSSHSPNLLYSSKALGEGTLSSQLASQNAVSGLGNIGSASDLYRPSIFGTLPSATGPLVTYSGASANSVFGALPATGDAAFGQSLSNLSGSEGVLSRFPVGYRPPPLETAGLYPSGTGGIGGILGGRVGDVASKAGDFASKVLSPSALLQASTYGSNEVPAGGGLFSGVLDQLPRAPTITYLDHAPISSGVPAQAGFERTSNIGVPSKYSSVPTELPPDTAPPPELPYGSGFDPYASTTDPNFDVSRFLGVGSLNETGQNMFRFSHGGGVGSLNETARAMPYADGGIVPADMVWVLDEDGVERLYPKSLVKREYSDEPLPVEGDFMANLQGVPETVDRYSRTNAREERQFDDWQDNRSGLHPTASLTSLNIGTDNWGAGGRFGIGAGANTIDVGANIDRAGVNFSDLKARLRLGDVSSDLRLLGPLLDPDRFEGALNAPVGQGRVALTGGVPLKDSGEPNVALTYRQEFAVGGPAVLKAASMVWQPFKVKIKNQAIFGDFMGYTKTGKVRVLDQESGVEKLYPKSRVRRAYSDEPLPDEPVKKVLGGAIVKGAVKTLTKPKKAPKRKEYKDEFSEYEVYHGTRDDIREFNLDHPNRKDSGWLGTGVYTNTDPRIASAYSTLKRGDVGSNVMPLRARLENPYHATQAEKNRLMTISNNQGAEAGREAADAWTAELKQKGHDGVILSSGNEGHREVVVFDPKNIRSKFAQFDPAKRGSADILAATGGGVIIKGAAKVLTKKREAPLLPPETNRLMLTKQNSGWYEGSIGNHAIDLDRNASPDRKEWVLKVDNEWEETFPTKRSAVEHIKKRYGASYATGGGISSLNGIARNMTRYAYGGGVGSMNEIARSM